MIKTISVVVFLVVVAPDDHGGEGEVDVEGAVDITHPGHQLLTRPVHPGLAAPQPREDPAVHHQHQLHVSILELQTKVREDFIIIEKGPTTGALIQSKDQCKGH